MLKTKERLIINSYRIIDIAVVALSFVIAFGLRSKAPFAFLKPFDKTFGELWWYFLSTLFILWHLLNFNSVYVSYRGRSVKKIILAVLKANIQGLLLQGFLLFFIQEYLIHRTLILIFFIVSTSLLSLEKVILFNFLHYIRRLNKNLKCVLIIGTGNRAINLIKLFRTHQEAGFRVIGLLGNNPAKVGRKIEGIPVIGLSNDLQKKLYQHAIDEVFIAISMQYNEEIKKMLLECEQFGINARIMAQIYNPVKASVYVDELLDIPFITFTTKPLKIYQLHLKDIFDILVSLTFIVLFSPLFLIIALLIKFDSKGPVLYKQERAGLNGRKFIIYKFRSMVEDADSKRLDLEKQNEMNGPVFKIKNDPRITQLGKFLRRASLDELPQLLNVLKQDISLVGPRPLPGYESEKIVDLARRRLSMKPGITGLWQVSGRTEIDFDKWMELDLEYIDNWSLWLDAKILFKTAAVLFSGKGAY